METETLMTKMLRRSVSLIAIFLFTTAFASAAETSGTVRSSGTVNAAKDPIADFPNRVKKFTLPNGLRAVVVERPESPTISFAMFIRTGGIDDEMGKSGLAHMFEHMLFKGTKTIGTKDYAKEAPLLAKMDAADAALMAENDKGEKADKTRLKKPRTSRSSSASTPG